MKKCAYCAEEIQQAAVVCKHCGRDLADPIAPAATATSPKTATGLADQPKAPTWRPILLGIVAVVGVVTLVVQVMSRNAAEAAAQNSIITAAAYVRPAREIAIAPMSDIDLPAGSRHRFDWEVPADQPRCQLTGHIEVTAGGNKDIQVFVATPDEYTNLTNGHTANVYLGTEKTTVINLDLTIATPGPIVVALSNRFSTLTSKRVQLRDVKATCT